MDIEEIRQEISRIDDEMADLFVRRMQAAEKVAAYKRECGLPVEDKKQEKRVIEGHSGRIDDDELREYYIRFLTHVMEVSKSWQHRLLEGQKVAYRGPENLKMYKAVRSEFPSSSCIAYSSYEQVYQAVADGVCDIAVLPFENGLGGEVGKVMDLIFTGDLFVNAVYTIEDDEDVSRYAVLSRVEKAAGTDQGAFLLMFTVQDEIGSLAKAINVISAFDFNMRVMRSRPMKDLQWHFYFYVEAVGDDTSENGRKMLNALRVVCPSVKVAGRYAL